MNWMRFYMVLFALTITCSYVRAQANLLNAKKVKQIGYKSKDQIAEENDVPFPYGSISDNNIMWSKIVWEYLDLNQKINLNYYYPTEDTKVNKSRRSLYQTLLQGIENGEIEEVYDDSYFTAKIGMEEIKKKTHNEVQVAATGQIDVYTIKSSDIKGYLIKGIWYFNKRQGELNYRILALAPMGPDVHLLGKSNIVDDGEYPLFWVFYPDARKTLHASKVFNPTNSAQQLSYDILLNARRFNSTIRKEENLYGDREIKDYVRGNSLFQLLEADKIKEGIRDREMDMWNY